MISRLSRVSLGSGRSSAAPLTALWSGGRGEPASGRRATVLRSGRALLRAERSDHVPRAVPRRLELRIVPEPVAVEAVELTHELHDLIRDRSEEHTSELQSR